VSRERDSVPCFSLGVSEFFGLARIELNELLADFCAVNQPPRW
jgi:hypothetical protein